MLPLWVIVILLIQFCKISAAHWGSSWLHLQDLPIQLSGKDERLSQASAYTQPIFGDADEAIQSLEETRLCKREATLTLISTATCKDLLQEPNRGDVEGLMDLYAIELAKCEIESASIKLPRVCQFEYPRNSQEKNTASMLQSNINQCLSALHTKPQWWTSYSNHRRDGYQWCLVMRPGFDHNEHTKTWRSIYKAMDISISAIKDTLHDILSTSQSSQNSMNSLVGVFGRIMETVQSSMDRNVDNIEKRFEDVQAMLHDRTDVLFDALSETETKMKDVRLVTDSSTSELQNVYGAITDISGAQQTQQKQMQAISSELLAIRSLTRDTIDNLTSEQDFLLKKFVTITETSDQLGQRFLAANDYIKDLNAALAGLANFSGIGKHLNWIILVIAAAFYNRKIAVHAVLVLLLHQEFNSYFDRFQSNLSNMIWASLHHSYHFWHILRLLLIFGIVSFLIVVRRNSAKPKLVRTGTEEPRWSERIEYHVRSSIPYNRSQTPQKHLSSVLPQYHPGDTIATNSNWVSRRFLREQSSPL